MLLAAALAACSPGALDAQNNGGDDDDTCQGLLGDPQATAGMTECCDLGGGSHCLPDSTVPAEFLQYTEPCTGGGTCVPDPFIETGGVYTPPSCSSLNGAVGVCLSACIPQVREYEAILPSEGCGTGERCVPCVSPIDGMPTGACDIKGECVGGNPGPTDPPPDDGDDPTTCVHEGNPVINPAGMTSCGEGAHCLQAALVPADFASRLGPCTDPAYKCVPDIFLITGGDFVLPTCRSLNDAEGRCVSKVLPEVAAQADLLPVLGCGGNEACVPCFNPLDGANTGVCNISCDTGPAEAAKPLAACCDARAKCVPTAIVPAEMTSNLEQDTCEDIQPDAFLCVPNDLLAYQAGTGPAPRACAASGFLIGDYTGVCLSDCLSFGFQGIALAQGNCNDDYTCAPCANPLSGEPTGAPGCPATP